MKLIIVESPTKAKTISKFLGKGYKVLSSFGHVRDLPTSTMGIDIKHDFAPKYVIPKKSTKVVAELRKAAKAADEIYFATDEDREGEAISWHLSELLKIKAEKAKRITFHEITKEAIEHALKAPRHIDERMVDAQQARRVLDRLVGYELSPFLWRKVARGLSAGRVQSVVVRLIVEREREVLAFKPEEYWSIEAEFLKKGVPTAFEARLHSKDGETLDKMAIPNEAEAKGILKTLEKASYSIETVEKKTSKRSPAAPFTTSTLQQDSNNKLGYSAKQTMMLAQQLYEGVELGVGPRGVVQSGPVRVLVRVQVVDVEVVERQGTGQPLAVVTLEGATDRLAPREVAEEPRVVLGDEPCRLRAARADQLDVRPCRGAGAEPLGPVGSHQVRQVGLDPRDPTQLRSDEGADDRVVGQAVPGLLEGPVDRVVLDHQVGHAVDRELAPHQAVDELPALSGPVCGHRRVADPDREGRVQLDRVGGGHRCPVSSAVVRAGLFG